MSAIISLLTRNPIITLAGFGIIGAGGVLYFLYERYRPETRVSLIEPETGRWDTIKINHESPTTLRSFNKINPRRFFKYQRGFIESRSGKRITNFLGKRGTAYTWKIDDEGKEVKIGSLFDGLNLAWDPALVAKIPEDAKALLKTSDLYVTVKLADGLTPKGYADISEEHIIKEGDRDMALVFAESARKTRTPPLLFIILSLGMGGLLTVFALGMLGWLRVGA